MGLTPGYLSRESAGRWNLETRTVIFGLSKVSFANLYGETLLETHLKKGRVACGQAEELQEKRS